ncbi:MAG: hypothetical protein J7K23_05285 [Thermoproteales archaeon]|nr:hypothetical protein [Thermoproteales archaeon]
MIDIMICFIGVVFSVLLLYIASSSISSKSKRKTKPYYCGEKGEALKFIIFRGKVEYFILFIVLEFVPIVTSFTLLSSQNFIFTSLSLMVLSIILFLVLQKLIIK